ncbi:MAG: tRNA (N6-isopentenyl adenosine(37)-C2)-methylthiotransferase MiaB [Bacilli bacterium]|nr:tRNA (N6-isopentenyl adenosine(37)-C2)-methylthiotransferase MiaB [Bacilli bacterium]MDD4411634.1 tRNA (N6-isopentenyl adenosine(37)-C2)-methylthiotransferase MiaB [Bacilli bacterium]
MQIPNFKESKKRGLSKINVIRDKYEIGDELTNLGVGKKYFIKTYGCQMNIRDTETIKALLEGMSYTQTDNYEEADLMLLNTCAIRENVHNKVFGMLGRFKHLKMTRPNIIVGMCGCMAQEEVVVNKILDKYKWMDFVIGTHNMHRLPIVLGDAVKKQNLEVEVWSKEGDIIENVPVKRDSKYKAWVNIMYGCDKFCTYCIVPFTRGKQRSRKPEDVINEVKELVADGYQEVTLLGQNVNAYGKDFDDFDYKMENLLEDISKTGINRIRFVTSHPWDFTDGMIEVIKNNSNIMPYFHLPIQSGSNKILKIMGRRYNRERYLELFNKIKDSIPNASITTDIIVGFPNETEDDFNDTLDIVNECCFDGAYTFIYSPREGTPAAKMEDNITLEEKEKRLHILNKVVNKYSKISNDKLLHKIVPVLIEGVSEKNDDMLMGYTDTFILVNVSGDKKNIGHIVDVEITDIKSWSLNGRVINDN